MRKFFLKEIKKSEFSLIVIIGLMCYTAQAQQSPSGQSKIIVPSILSGCAIDTIEVELTNLTGESCPSISSPPTATYAITIPGGSEIEYASGSLISFPAGASFVSYSSKVLTFTVPLPALGYTTKVKFAVLPTCNVTSITPLPVFDIAVTYPTGVTPTSESWKSTKMNVGVGQLSVGQFTYVSTTNPVVGFNQQYGWRNRVTNSGFGTITELEYHVVLDDSVFHWYTNDLSNIHHLVYQYTNPNTPSVVDGIYWAEASPYNNGVIPGITVTSSTLGGKRYYKIKYSGTGLGKTDQELNPGEFLDFYGFFRGPKTCNPDQVVKEWFTYKCASGGTACARPDTFTNIVKISAGIPIISATNTSVQTWDGCPGKTGAFTFRNTGTPMSGRPEVSTAYDVDLGVNFGGLINITNLTFGGTTFATTPATPGNVKSVSWKIKNTLTTDIDGPGGLQDLDGDGFYDDLRPGDTVRVTFTYAVPCDLACGADLDYNMTAVSSFTDYCGKLNGTGASPIYRFGFAQTAPVSQKTPLPNFGTMSNSLKRTRTGVFTFNYRHYNVDTSQAIVKLRINYSSTMQVVEPIQFLGTNMTLGQFTQIGSGSMDTANGAYNKNTDKDSALEYTLTKAELRKVLDNVGDSFKYTLVHIACDSFQKTIAKDGWQLTFQINNNPCPGPTAPPCALDLACNKSFAYQVTQGCGSKPCYTTVDSIYRTSPKGFTSEEQTTGANPTPAGTTKFYEGDTMTFLRTTQLNANYPFMERIGDNLLHVNNWNFLSFFSFSYNKNPGSLFDLNKSPYHFIPDISRLRVKDTVTNTYIADVPLKYSHFYNWDGGFNNDKKPDGGAKYEGDNQTDDPINYGSATDLNSVFGKGLGDYWDFHNSWTLDGAAGPWGDRRYRTYTPYPVYYWAMMNDAETRVSESYYLYFERALVDAGISFEPGYSRYVYEIETKWRVNPDFPHNNVADMLEKGGIQRNGNGVSVIPGTYMSSCSTPQAIATTVTKEMQVEGGGATYATACDLKVCNSLFLKATTGDYFPSEVRIPFKLDSVTMDLPAEYHTTGATTLAGSNGGPTNSIQKTGTSSAGGLTGHIVYTNNTTNSGTSYTDFPRVSDADGGQTAWSICDSLSNNTTDNFVTETYKIPVKYYLRDEFGVSTVLIDTFSLTESTPAITLAPLGGSIKIDDGGACSNSYMDVLVSNNTIYAASNVFISVVSNTNTKVKYVEDIGPAEDPIVAADTNFYGQNLYVELGGMKAGGRRVVRVYFNTTLCSDSLKILSNFGCNYPASNQPEYPSTTIDSAYISFTANSPYLLSAPLGGNISVTNLCDVKKVEIEIRNASNVNVTNILAGFKLPPNATYVAGSAQIAYPSTTYVNAPTVTTSGTDSITINISSDLNLAVACGLPGIDDASNSPNANVVKVRFNVDFNACPTGTSNSVFYNISGTNFCGLTTLTSGVQNFVYLGSAVGATQYSCKALKSSDIAVCAIKGETQNVKDRLVIKNISGATSVSGDTMEISIGLDTSRLAVSNFTTIAPWNNPIETTNAQGRKVVKFAIPAGIALNDSLIIELRYDLKPKVDNICNNPSATCPDIAHSVSFYSVPVIVCASKGLSCNGVGKLSKGTGFVPRDLKCCAELGNYVWLDDDKDGIQDANEVGVAGVTVTLYDSLGSVIASTVTDAYGKYLFPNLIPGSYSVQFTPPANYEFTTQTTGTATGSDVNPTSGRTPLLRLNEGNSNMTLDAGLIQAAPIGQNVGDYVWYDSDKDGIQDAGEDGIAGITVTLYDNSGNVIGTTITDVNGKYNFPNVPAGTYTVGFTPPVGFVGTTQTSATNDGSDMSPTTFKTASFTVTAGTDRTDIDAGFYQQDEAKAALGNLVWNDLDNDGIQDAGESGVAGVTVTLYDNGGSPIKSVLTDAYGNYVFNDLAPGTYSVGFSNFPSGFTLSPQNTGGTASDSMDSDANTGTGRTGNYTLVAGERNMSVDAGIYNATNTYTLGNYVWLDSDKDGVQDPTEAGVAGVMVILKNSSGVPIDTTYTDKDGKYLFTNLAAGDYSVQVKNYPNGLNITTKDSPSGTDATDSDADASGSTGTVTLNGGNPNDMTLDIGLQPAPSNSYTASLGNRLWYDGDADGIQDDGEPGIPGTKVYLFAADGVTKLDSTVTDAKGEYIFTGLAANSYIVGAVVPSGYTLSTKGAGTDASIDNNGNPISGGITKSDVVSLSNGEENLSIDFGISKASALIVGNKVWLDTDQDGIQDAGEDGVPNIGVRLIDKLGNVVGTTVTDANGNYLFVDVPAGSGYKIQFTNLPPGYVFTTKDTSIASNTTDSDPSKLSGYTDTFSVTSAYTWSTNDSDPQLSYDAGIYPNTVAAVKGTYWVDANGDGVQDAGESGIPGMRVTLYDGSGNPVASVITDADGNYLFPNVTPGNGYTVGFEAPPAGTTMTQQNTPGTIAGASNSDADPTTRRTAPFNLVAGQIQPDVDAGVETPILGSIGDKIWFDADSDGQQDASEPGVPGVVLELLDNLGNVIATAVTDANGNYLFSNLPAGTYSIRAAYLPPYFDLTKSNIGADGTDSDINEYTNTTGTITLAEGENRRDIDGGLVAEKAELGNFVWLDDDKDGVQDAGEPGVAGVNIDLYTNGPDGVAGNSDDVFVGTTKTDAYGFYQFKELTPGNYNLKITPPINYELTTQTNTIDSLNGAATNTLGSDFNSSTNRTYSINLTPGESEQRVDAGLIYSEPQTASIGDRVWFDADNDGVQDATESGLAGVTVTLYNSSGVPVATTITDANGNYLFDELTPGNYTIGVTLPMGTKISPQNATGDNEDSDLNPSTGRTSTITLAANQAIRNIDIGIAPTINSNASLGDKVWYDLNQDGIQDAGEIGVPGVTVELYDEYNVLQGTTTTDAFGNYMFTDLIPDYYKVRFIPPSGYVFSPKNSTADVFLGSDADVTTGYTGDVVLPPGARFMGIDAGIYQSSPAGSAQLGDKVWYDKDADGFKDSDEGGVAGITVTLYNSSNVAIGTTTTDINGNYKFINLPAGTYSVGFSNIPDDYGITTQTTGTSSGSDANPSTGRTPTVTLSNGQIFNDLDMGLTQGQSAGLASLGNKVWNDVDQDGIQDAGEVGVPGIVVYLNKDLNGDGDVSDPGESRVDSTITNGTGNYIFEGLSAGSYQVEFKGSSIPSGFTTTTANSGGNDEIDSDGTLSGSNYITSVVALKTGEDNMSLDLGIYVNNPALGSIGNFVWIDSDGDGVQDPGEQGLPGVQVTLYDASGNAIKVVTTDANGAYLFDGLPAGDYSVGIGNIPNGFTSSPVGGGTASTDSDFDPTSKRTGTISLTAGQDLLTVDAGLVPSKAALGNYVWRDNDADGVQDVGEPGVPGVTVILYDASNNPVASTMTDADGFYMFTNLDPGTYTVGFSTIPSGLNFTLKDAGGNDNTDSDVNPLTGKSSSVTLSAGQVNLSLDAGLVPANLEVGNYVWLDEDNDGNQDLTEKGIGGVVVKMFSTGPDGVIGGGDDVLLATTITNGEGAYLFTNVAPGNVYFEFSNSIQGYPFTTQNAVGDAVDSDVNSLGLTGVYTLSTANNYTIDAGVFGSIAALPLEYVFNANKLNNTSVLDLKVLNISTPLLGYEVYKSIDGVDYQKIGFVKFDGSYDIKFIDENPVIGNNFYKFNIVSSTNQLMTYVRVVNFSKIDNKNISLYPNPTNGNVQVNSFGIVGEKVEIEVTDINGKVVLSKLISNFIGTEIINLSDFANGTYQIKVKSQSIIYTEKVVLID